MGKNYNYLFFSVPVLIAVMVGCQKDYFKPESFSNNFIIKDIPAGFDWSSTSDVSLEITPADKYNNQYFYTLEVLDANPIFEQKAVRYAQGVAKGSQPLQITVTLPDARDTLFIRQTSPGGSESVYQVVRNGNRIICDLSASPVAQSVSAFASAVLTADPSISEKEYITPDDAQVISGQGTYTLQSKKSYVIKDFYKGTVIFPGEGNVSLYVEGSWENTASNNQQLEDNTHLIVQDGGKVTFDTPKNYTLSMIRSASIVVAGNGVFNENKTKINLTFEGKGLLSNKGRFYAQDITCKAGAELYNGGSMDIAKYNVQSANNNLNDGTFKAGEIYLNNAQFTNTSTGKVEFDDFDTENATINNYGKITGDELDLKRGNFNNNCLMHVKDLDLEGATLTVESNAIVKTNEMDIDGATLKLQANSMVHVQNTAEYSDWRSTIEGTGNSAALLKLNKVESKGSITYKGNLNIHCSSHPKNYTLVYPACFVKGNSSISIKPGECNDEGYEPDPEEPENPQFPIPVKITANHTWLTEDTYPGTGDYDLNDMVVRIDSIVQYQNAMNKIESMTFNFTVRAAGSTKRIGAALQLDKLAPAAIASVTRTTSLAGDMFELDQKGLEAGQTLAVAPLFDNLHLLLGADDTKTMVNTYAKGAVKPEQSFEITLKFNTPVNPEDITMKYLNFFTVIGEKFTPKRTEIHTPEFNHTDKSITAQQVQEATRGLMWGLIVPGNFRYPSETIDIRKAYPGFEKWINSNKVTDTDWYKRPIETNIYK